MTRPPASTKVSSSAKAIQLTLIGLFLFSVPKEAIEDPSRGEARGADWNQASEAFYAELRTY